MKNLGFHLVCVVLLVCLGWWAVRKDERKRAVIATTEAKEEVLLISRNSKFFNFLMDRVKARGLEVPCRPENGEKLEPCLTEDVLAMVKFIEDRI